MYFSVNRLRFWLLNSCKFQIFTMYFVVQTFRWQIETCKTVFHTFVTLLLLLLLRSIWVCIFSSCSSFWCVLFQSETGFLYIVCHSDLVPTWYSNILKCTLVRFTLYLCLNNFQRPNKTPMAEKQANTHGSKLRIHFRTIIQVWSVHVQVCNGGKDF